VKVSEVVVAFPRAIATVRSALLETTHARVSRSNHPVVAFRDKPFNRSG
jgi:hypothetical protein